MIIDPSKINEVSKEELVRAKEQVCALKEELDAEEKQINATLIEKIEGKEELIGDFIVKKITVVKYKPTEEWARDMGVLEMKPSIDMKRVKEIAKTGVDIPRDEFTYIKMLRAE